MVSEKRPGEEKSRQRHAGVVVGGQKATPTRKRLKTDRGETGGGTLDLRKTYSRGT